MSVLLESEKMVFSFSLNTMDDSISVLIRAVDWKLQIKTKRLSFTMCIVWVGTAVVNYLTIL